MHAVSVACHCPAHRAQLFIRAHRYAKPSLSRDEASRSRRRFCTSERKSATAMSTWRGEVTGVHQATGLTELTGVTRFTGATWNTTVSSGVKLQDLLSDYFWTYWGDLEDDGLEPSAERELYMLRDDAEQIDMQLREVHTLALVRLRSSRASE